MTVQVGKEEIYLKSSFFKKRNDKNEMLTASSRKAIATTLVRRGGGNVQPSARCLTLAADGEILLFKENRSKLRTKPGYIKHVIYGSKKLIQHI